ncbi:hypothetical protein B0A48_17818 [Cryoendolithus antarcticus]|uniref:Heterokaryon incompatibility domain-containing protein n=1 Tax=Cryoendolithus antarcticus TaxID=1507870 RepID=A0A1V8SAT3_9PEZI|nr:hypothetical protein B0A48_17818 [Cryoendolithus antarcticus]
MEHSAVRPFVYDQLTDPRTHIRLLQVFKPTSDSVCRCSLTSWTIPAVFPYTAISYAWGDPAEVVDIVVNGARMTVHSNCAYTLAQMSAYTYYWIDAICIDQSNDVEKSAQVQMMGAIYRDAHMVLACVGPHVEADNSRMLCKYLRDHESTLREFADKIEPGQGVARFPVITSGSPGAALLKKFAAVRYYSVLNLQEPMLRALLAMLQRPYFLRTWVAQELYMARKPALRCGSDVCDLAALTGLLVHATHDDPYWINTNRIRALETQHWLGYKQDPGSKPPRTPQMSESWPDLSEKLIEHVSIPALACRRHDQPLSLQTIMLETAHLQCADPRDKIYALLSMLRPKCARLIEVDYRKTMFELVTGVIPLMFEENVRDHRLSEEIKMGYLKMALVMYDLSRTVDVKVTDSAYMAAIAVRTISIRSAVETKPASCKLLGRFKQIVRESMIKSHHKICQGRSDEIRPKIAVSDTKTSESDFGNTRPRMRLAGWRGVQIWQTETGWICSVQEDSVISKDLRYPPQEELVEIKDTAGRIQAVVPNTVRARDWILQRCEGQFPGLVVRKDAQGSCKIISTAIITGPLPPRDKFWSDEPSPSTEHPFTVDFDDEDFTTLFYHHMHFVSVEWNPSVSWKQSGSAILVSNMTSSPKDDIDDSPAEIRKWIQDRYANPYAQPDYDVHKDPNRRQSPLLSTRTRQDFERYFSVGVCHRPGSSHAKVSAEKEPSLAVTTLQDNGAAENAELSAVSSSSTPPTGGLGHNWRYCV